MHVREHLRRAGEHHAGQRGAGEGGGVLYAAPGDDDLLCFDEEVVLILHYADALFEKTVGDGAQPELDAEVARLLFELPCDLEAAHTGGIFSGAEELVYLLIKLTADSGVFVNDSDLRAGFCRLDGGGDTGRTRADYEYFAL